jgi:hypothetical protein
MSFVMACTSDSGNEVKYAYKDTGCSCSSTCISCPLPQCRLELPRAQRMNLVLSLKKEGRKLGKLRY